VCGIAVAIDWDDAEATVRQLVMGVQHRGDVSDPIICPRPNSAFGTRRLRIVDAEHAQQPCFSFDGRLVLSFNGEIYNFRELRAKLEVLGVRFRTESDTEVWEKWQANLAKDPLGSSSPWLQKILATHRLRAFLISAYALVLHSWVLQMVAS